MGQYDIVEVLDRLIQIYKCVCVLGELSWFEELFCFVLFSFVFLRKVRLSWKQTLASLGPRTRRQAE